MSFAGSINRYLIDYNSVRGDNTVGSLLRYADTYMPQVFPPNVGDVAIAVDPDVGRDRWAVVTDVQGGWIELHLEDWLPLFDLLGDEK